MWLSFLVTIYVKSTDCDTPMEYPLLQKEQQIVWTYGYTCSRANAFKKCRLWSRRWSTANSLPRSASDSFSASCQATIRARWGQRDIELYCMIFLAKPKAPATDSLTSPTLLLQVDLKRSQILRASVNNKRGNRAPIYSAKNKIICFLNGSHYNWGWFQRTLLRRIA